MTVTFEDLKPETVVNSLEALERGLSFLKAFAALTPTQMDDNAVALAEKVIATIKPFAADPLFAKVLQLLASLFRKKSVADVVAYLQLIS